MDDIISSFRTDPRAVAQRRLARSYAWKFTARQKMDRQVAVLFEFDLFKGKRGKRLLAVVEGTSKQVAGRFRIYDYHYFGDLGKTSTSVLEYCNPELHLSPFGIWPKGLLNTFKEFFISPELLFATTPEFDERYRIDAEDSAAIKLDLNEDFLDEVGDEAGWIYEGRKDCLIAYQPGKLFPIDHTAPLFERFERMCERLVNGHSNAEFV
ncbi:MAG: hypothetical protein AAF990_26420 [Bacteroidota bacterium]